ARRGKFNADALRRLVNAGDHAEAELGLPLTHATLADNTKRHADMRPNACGISSDSRSHRHAPNTDHPTTTVAKIPGPLTECRVHRSRPSVSATGYRHSKSRQGTPARVSSPWIQ